MSTVVRTWRAGSVSRPRTHLLPAVHGPYPRPYLAAPSKNAAASTANGVVSRPVSCAAQTSRTARTCVSVLGPLTMSATVRGAIPKGADAGQFAGATGEEHVDVGPRRRDGGGRRVGPRTEGAQEAAADTADHPTRRPPMRRRRTKHTDTPGGRSAPAWCVAARRRHSTDAQRQSRDPIWPVRS